ncbi:hypothetical protein DL95DRAFT_474730, partial [Leptodontidium sp. 2 PMI_412]
DSTKTTMTSCSDAFPTRSVRNSSVDTEAAALKVHPLGRDLTWHDFVLLASTVRSDSNPHHAGHRVNTVLSSDSFKIGTGASFIVRGLKPWMCPDSDIEAVAAKIPSIAFKKRRVGSNNGHNSSLHAALSELRILAHPPLRSHKNIVELLGMAWMKNDSPKNVISEESPLDYWPVLLLEYSSLGALPDLWKSSLAKGDLPKTEVRLKLCLDVASGLKALHDCDVVHGDLKCENVLVFKEGDIYTAKLADFGYSVTQLEKHDGLLGHTLPWNPPEDNNDFNFLGLKAADIYTLGFVIWRIMMNGDHPFMSSASGHMLDDDSILLLKKQESFWEWAFEMANAKMMKDDFFGWFSFSSFAKGLFFSTLHTTPLERSLRHTLGILAQLDMIGTEEEAVAVMKKIEKRHRDPTRKFQHPTRDEESDVFEGPMVVYSELLSPDLNFAKAYAALSFSISEQPLKVRQFLVKSWVDAYHLAMQPERIKLARTLFIYFLEVELDRSEALKWLLLSAEEGDLIAQPIIYRAFSALQRPLPESIPVKDWLMEGAMRGSPIAMKDLEYLDSKAIGNAKRELVCHYGGIGIDMFKDIEVLIVNLAKEVVRVAACENLGQFSDAVHLQEDLCWAKEIVSEIGASSKVASTRTDEHWSPEWDSQPVATQTHWEAYSKNRMHAFRDTFRIEEDTVYAINVVGDTILHFAASKGLVNFLTFLVETFHPPLTVLNICYETPLLQACRSGHFQTAYYLLEHDIDPFLSRRGETPLHWLFKIENNEERELLAQRLISKGVSATQTAFSPTELHLASGREPQIGTVISDSSALGWATERGCLSTLRCLLSVYSFDENHLKIAIMHASECWEAGCLHLLTTAYADQGLPKLDAEFFYTCVSRAISVLKFSGLIYPLLRHGNNWLKAFGDTRERLQAMGAEPRSSKSAALGDSGTVLQTAATCGPPEIMANLLESGWAKELNTPGFQQQVPIAMAAILGRGELFSLMLRYDNKETLPDRMVPLRDGMHIYHWLAEGKNDCLPLAKELLSLGVEYYENELRS